MTSISSAEPDGLDLVDTCARCGRLFPNPEPKLAGHSFCEPCRHAMWQEEREGSEVGRAVLGERP